VQQAAQRIKHSGSASLNSSAGCALTAFVWHGLTGRTPPTGGIGDVDELVASIKRTPQFHPSAVSAVLPLLARQWETAVELVELMPRHGHVHLHITHTHTHHRTRTTAHAHAHVRMD
jgi:hypothetical protein